MRCKHFDVYGCRWEALSMNTRDINEQSKETCNNDANVK